MPWHLVLLATVMLSSAALSSEPASAPRDAALEPYLGTWVFKREDGDKVIIDITRKHVVMAVAGQHIITPHQVRDGSLFRRGFVDDATQQWRRHGDDLQQIIGGGEKPVTYVHTTDAADREAASIEPMPFGSRVLDQAEAKRLSAEYARRFKEDQDTRAAFAKQAGNKPIEQWTDADRALWQKVDAADAENMIWFRATLQDAGWPTRSHIGAKAAQAALFLTLHSGDIRLSRAAAIAMKKGIGDKSVSEKDYAMVSDRLAMSLGEPMRYGVQATQTADGTVLFPVIADRVVLDANRKRIGQPPFAKQIRMMGPKVKVIEIAP